MGLLDGLMGGVVGGGDGERGQRADREARRGAGIVVAVGAAGAGEHGQVVGGAGSEQAITADQVHAALGPEVISGCGGKFLGWNPQDLAQKLAQALRRW